MCFCTTFSPRQSFEKVSLVAAEYPSKLHLFSEHFLTSTTTSGLSASARDTT
jgi:hypothetical protein